MASGSLVGQSGGREKDKFYSRNNQSKSKIPKSVPHSQQQYSRKTLAINTDDNSPTASDDSSSQPGALNRESSLGNEFPGYAKFDSFVKISFDLSNRQEVRALKRKLLSELDQVKSLAKRLKTTEMQFSKTGNRSTSKVSANMNGIIDGVRGNSVDKEKMAHKNNQFYKNFDVVERLNPMDDNKNTKSSKNGNEFILTKDLSRLLNCCRNLLEKLMKHKYGWVFNEPVDVKGLGLHDYYTIIKHPMDLGTVKARLSKNLYRSPVEFAEDVRTTFNNAMLYNPKGQDVHIMAEDLSKIFEEKWKQIEAEYNFSRRQKMGHDSGLATPSPKLVPTPPLPVHTRTPPLVPTHASAPVSTPAPVHTPSPVHTPLAPASPPQPLKTRTLERVESVTMPEDLKTKVKNMALEHGTLIPQKSKAKDPDKRDMTYEEKQRLSIILQELPSDKLDYVVQIIKKRNPVLSQQDDEIEVDIDSFDPDTLWELHRFVTNYKKSLSMNKGKAEVAPQATAEAGNNIHERNMEPSFAEVTEEAEVVEKIVSISSPILEEKHDDEANESSSSSGSSSDTGSSSSDSDSAGSS